MEELCHELQIIQASSLPELHCSAGPPGPQVSEAYVMKPHHSLTCSKVLTKLWNMKMLFTTQKASQALAKFHFDKALHKSCRLFTLCSHPCLTHFILFQVHPAFNFCGVLQWVIPIKKSQMHHHFLQMFLASFLFALDSVLFFFVRTRACGVDAQGKKWTGMLAEYIPEKANIYSKIRDKEGLSRALGWDSGGAGSPSFTCNISASDLLDNLRPVFLTSHLISYNLFFHKSSEEVRNLRVT